MADGLEKLSKKTRERAYILAKNAKEVGVPLGAVRFRPSQDYMCYWLTNSVDWLIIFCTPDGYLVEIHNEHLGSLEVGYLAVRNIRHFLQHLKRADYQDADVYFESNEPDDSIDIRSYLEGQDE